MPLSFTEGELELIRESLSLKFCLLESGQVHISYDDMLRMDEASREHWGVRMPSREQLEEARKYRALWERILQRRSR